LSNLRDLAHLHRGTAVARSPGVRANLLVVVLVAACTASDSDEAPLEPDLCDGVGNLFAADPDTGLCYGPFQDCLQIPAGWTACQPCTDHLECGAEQHCEVQQPDEDFSTPSSGGRCEPGAPAGTPPPSDTFCSSNATCATGEVCPAEFGGCSYQPDAALDECPSACEPSCAVDDDCGPDLVCNAPDICAMAVDQRDDACRGWCVPP
jgi:hypothetical protein